MWDSVKDYSKIEVLIALLMREAVQQEASQEIVEEMLQDARAQQDKLVARMEKKRQIQRLIDNGIKDAG